MPGSSEYGVVRSLTEQLAAPLGPEDQTVQSMPDASPTKWHRAHTTWFFEEFVLGARPSEYRVFHEGYAYLFNSYYEAVGPRHPRPERGVITRPSAAEVGAYRRHVDSAMARLLDGGTDEGTALRVELGLHHEQQHQELLIMDIQHALSRNPLAPAYGTLPWEAPVLAPGTGTTAPGWLGHDGGIVEVGHGGPGFAFDNESPRHEVLLRPFELSASLVTNGDWLSFMADGGYERPELWMSEGWALVRAQGWRAPEYWRQRDDGWWAFGLAGLQPVRAAEAVVHVSWFEADAFARWAGARLPRESEWEALVPAPGGATAAALGFYGTVWQWTASPYTAYPGFAPSAGAIGEYNGKFMVNQQVLRGSCRATPPGHARRTYRNFFPPQARWMFAGVRLARDAA
ncbi:MAG: ergothioneine biosynthesis protein EgtB [Acidimicrobiales bacterium]